MTGFVRVYEPNFSITRHSLMPNYLSAGQAILGWPHTRILIGCWNWCGQTCLLPQATTSRSCIDSAMKTERPYRFGHPVQRPSMLRIMGP